MSYDRIARKLASGEVIIIDGGTGTDIQSRGVPMANETWCAEANLTHPAVVRCVHEDYIAAGAEVVTANTYPTSPLLFNALGRDDDMILIDKEAVRIAREASDGRVTVAGSFSVMRPMEPGADRVKKYREWSEKDAQGADAPQGPEHGRCRRRSHHDGDDARRRLFAMGDGSRHGNRACRYGSALRPSPATMAG